MPHLAALNWLTSGPSNPRQYLTSSLHHHQTNNGLKRTGRLCYLSKLQDVWHNHGAKIGFNTSLTRREHKITLTTVSLTELTHSPAWWLHQEVLPVLKLLVCALFSEAKFIKRCHEAAPLFLWYSQTMQISEYPQLMKIKKCGFTTCCILSYLKAKQQYFHAVLFTSPIHHCIHNHSKQHCLGCSGCCYCYETPFQVCTKLLTTNKLGH